MTTYKAIIIDDEVNIQESLKILVHQNCPEIKIIGTAISAKEGRFLLNSNDVHLIFLDISMPRENGFEFLNTIPKEKYAIIFTTAHEEFALKAIKASAIDYLLKPIDPEELKDAVSKAISYLNLRNQKKEFQETYKTSLEDLTAQSSIQKIEKLTVVEKFGFKIVEIKQIKYLEADSNYTILHLSGFEKIVSSKSLGEFEKVLDLHTFFRIHKSTLVNLHYLKGFSSYQGYFAILDDETKLTISRRRFNEFREAVSSLSKSID